MPSLERPRLWSFRTMPSWPLDGVRRRRENETISCDLRCSEQIRIRVYYLFKQIAVLVHIKIVEPGGSTGLPRHVFIEFGCIDKLNEGGHGGKIVDTTL